MFEIGSSLREARTRQGIDLAEMELRTKVRAKYLRALEDEQFDVLPGQTYVKGFLRTYADALGLDGQLYVDEYNSRFVPGEADSAPQVRYHRVPAAGRREGRRDRRHRREARAVMLALVAIAAVTALVIAAWKVGAPEEETVRGLEPTGVPTATAAATRRATLELRARGTSYAEVRTGSATGKPLYVGTLERGDVQRFRGRAIYVTLAAPDNVLVRLNGNRTEMPEGGEALATPDGLEPPDGS